MKFYFLMTLFLFSSASIFAMGPQGGANTGCDFTKSPYAAGLTCVVANGNGFSTEDGSHLGAQEVNQVSSEPDESLTNSKSYYQCMQNCMAKTSLGESLCDIRCGGW